MRPSRSHTPDLQPRPSTSSSLARMSLPVQKNSSGVHSSATWTSTSGDLAQLSDTDELDDRKDFVEEYNRLAKKHGIRPLVPDHPDNLEASGILQKRGWWSRTFRRTSSQSTENSLRRQRSTSHVMSHLAHPKRDSLRDQDLQGLVRLCGKSFLYLPPEYTPGSLLLPTCFRSTAQYLVQNGPGTRGVFRIPGSVRVVNELYEYYCVGQSGEVASTVRSPNLPAHINAGIHDVASCFKKFLSGLPGGILGSLSLFDSMIAINSQLYGDPEFSRTKQSKIRARLIALAVSTLRSQFRRELICAVFGLLCLLGRAAEIAPREDELGRPLPTSDLMGYNALGIVFGPLLVGDMLSSYTVRLSDPCTGLYLAPNSPASSKSQKGSQKGSHKASHKGKKKAQGSAEDLNQQHFLDVDKIHVANNITEMLVTNWRDVARQMRNLDADIGILRSRSRSTVSKNRMRRSNSFGRTSDNDFLGIGRSERRADDHSRSFEKSTEYEPKTHGRYPTDEPRSYGRYDEDEPKLRGRPNDDEPRSRGRNDEDEPRYRGRYDEDEPRHRGRHVKAEPRSFGRHPEDGAKSHGRRNEDRQGIAGTSGNRAVSFRQIDSTNDALSVKKTRPTSVRNVSNMRSASGQLGALSPPREESGSDDHDIHPALRSSTPLKSSLKSSNSKLRPDLPASKDASGVEEAPTAEKRRTPPPPPRSPDRVSSGLSMAKNYSEPPRPQSRQRTASSPYSPDARHSEHEQTRPRASPNPTGTHKQDYDQPGQRATPTQTRTTTAEHAHSRQRATPTRSETHVSNYDQPRPRTTPTRSESYSPEYSEAETPRAGLHQSQQQVPPSPADRLATTWKPGYNYPRPQSTPNSTDILKPRTEYGVDYTGNECSHRCTSVSSANPDHRPAFPRLQSQMDGSPDRNQQQQSAGLDPLIAYQNGPGMKILRAPSTMRSQPKLSHVDADITPAKLRSSVWKTSSRGSSDSVVLADYEPVKKSDPSAKLDKAAPHQMDGAADFNTSALLSRGSFMDVKGEFEGPGARDSHPSSLAVCKSRAQPRVVLTKMSAQVKKAPCASPRKSSPRSMPTGRSGVRPRASKVMGLAAMFDTAAKASPYLPTPGGAVQKRRGDSARVISPYTSNPSPRASVQSITSVSTPVSLMSPTRLSIHLSTPARSGGKKSMIPRLQNPSATYATGKTQRHISPTSVVRQDASRLSITNSSTPSRTFTPSRLPIKKKIFVNESPCLPQFDGVSSAKQSVLTLTAQQEIRPAAGYYSSPIPQSKPGGGGKAIPHLSKSNRSSRYSEERVHSRESSSASPTLSGVRSASSLRDQIRSLRTELSSKNEDCAQLRLELEESRKTKDVNEILLREDLDRANTDAQNWRRRAVRAERKVEKYERLAMQIKDACDHGSGQKEYRRERIGDTTDDYSYISGSDHLTISDRAASQPLTARMNQGVRRTPPVGANGANSIGTSDGLSECSSSTVVRTHVGPDKNGPVSGGGLWTAMDELVDFASPGLLEGPL